MLGSVLCMVTLVTSLALFSCLWLYMVCCPQMLQPLVEGFDFLQVHQYLASQVTLIVHFPLFFFSPAHTRRGLHKHQTVMWWSKQHLHLRLLSCFPSFIIMCTAWDFPAIFRIFRPFLVFWRETAAKRSHDLNYTIMTCDDVIVSPHPIKAGCTCVH